MTLTELQAAVILETNRPDLITRTLQSVQSATLKAHQSDFYPRDIFETGLNLNDELYEHDFEVTTFIPRFRAIKYFRHYDNIGSVPGAFFEVISPENVLDSYNCTRTNVCYLGGAEIHIKSPIKFQYTLFGCYINPDISVGSYDSWIATYHPFAIIYEAAAMIARSTGNTDKFKSLRDLAVDEYLNLSVNNIQAVGY